MREIKFRAWHPEYGWAGFEIALLECVHGGEPYFDNPNEWTWEQYTGLKDKNGTEIYEGHILKSRWETVVVEWGRKDIRGPAGHGGPGSTYNCYGYVFGGYLGFDPSKAEIIGNIHENPELVE